MSESLLCKPKIYYMKPSLRVRKAIAFMTVFIVFSCCKDEDCFDPSNPDCENYDPCFGVERPTAKFAIEARVRNNDGDIEYVEDPNVFPGILTQFRSEFEGDGFSHTWYVGSEILHDSHVIRDFATVKNRPAIISISHVLDYPIDQKCYPMDVGRDSVSQSFYLIKYWDELLTNGTFRVLLENEQDSFDFKIRRLQHDGSRATAADGWGVSVAINFHNEGDSTDAISFFEVNNRGYFTGNGFTRPNGFLTVDFESKKVNAEYKFRGESFKLRGRKLN